MRVSTMAGVPRFMHEGIVITPEWSPIDLGKLTPEQRTMFFNQVGTIIKVHPDDESEIPSALQRAGLEYFTPEDGRRRVRPATQSAQPPQSPPQTAKPDEKTKAKG